MRRTTFFILQTGVSSAHYSIYAHLRNLSFAVRRRGFPWLLSPPRAAPRHLRPAAQPDPDPSEPTTSRSWFPRLPPWAASNARSSSLPRSPSPSLDGTPEPPAANMGLVFDVFDRSAGPTLTHKRQHTPDRLRPDFVVLVADIEMAGALAPHLGLLEAHLEHPLVRDGPTVLRGIVIGASISFERIVSTLPRPTD